MEFKDTSFVFRMNPKGQGQVLLNGVDLTSSIARVEIVAEAQKLSEIVLHCLAYNVEVAGVADIATVTPFYPDGKPPAHRDVTKCICEICGGPVACVVTDIIDLPPEKGFGRVRPFGPQHYYCDAHKRQSLRYTVEGQPAANVVDDSDLD
jgi:hypothetical protein